MNKSHNAQWYEKRMLTIEEASPYIGLGLTKSRSLLKNIGAERHFGRRVVYDRKIIDFYLDSLGIEEGVAE